MTAQATLRTRVAIIGAGPAGLMLARLLELAGIDSVVLEARSRRYVEQRVRAGILEQNTMDLLDRTGVGDRMRREGLVHGGIFLQLDGERVHVPMSELADGRAITVYGQQEVVRDLVAARVEAGLPLLFETVVDSVSGIDGETPRVHATTADGGSLELGCEIVVGADGFHGVSRSVVPAAQRRVFEREYPFAWLGILADAPPSSDELVYARHADGFALLSMRSPSVTRLYLQCQPDDDLSQWPDDRVWEQLAIRLGTPGWTLQTGPVTDKSVTPMRSVVAEPMRHGRLFLAGDSAHIVPPTGAKGLNLALADIAVLAPALIDWLTTGSQTGVEAYSRTALQRVWRAQDFSNEMTAMLHVSDDRFENRRQRARLARTMTSTDAMRVLADAYVGQPLTDRSAQS